MSNQEEEKSAFAEVFKEWERSVDTETEIKKCQVVEGHVVSIDHETVFVAIEGLKQEARVPLSDFI